LPAWPLLFRAAVLHFLIQINPRALRGALPWLKNDVAREGAPGRVVRTPAIQIFRFANGKIVESCAARDDLGTLRQLGHFPPPASGR
jgi:hypothetical protein